MDRPLLEVADVIRAAGASFVNDHREWLRWPHIKTLNAIERCRTAALGGHVDECSGCGRRAISYNSCRNRHCPKCQANARHRWLAARRAEVLPTRYFHVVFTLPHALAPLALANKSVVYELLFRTSAETLLEVARDPRRLGADIGFFSVLHTWNQKLEHHPHVHCVVPEGGLAPDHRSWVRSRYPRFFLPVKVLGSVFRGKFTQALEEAFRAGRLRFPGALKPFAAPKIFAQLLRRGWRRRWVVYAKAPFGGPEHVINYLGNYTHRVAISNHRLLSLENVTVAFRWRDSVHGNQQRVMSLPVDEFLRRFLLHLLPRGFVRIRYFGFLAHRRRKLLLPLCRELMTPPTAAPSPAPAIDDPPAQSFWACPACGGSMVIVERLTPVRAIALCPARSP